MKITLKNADIAKDYSFVEQIKVKGKDALALAKFIKLLKRTLTSAGEDEQSLVAQYALKDEDGESKTDPNGNVQLDPALIREYNKVHGEWLEQEAEIEGGTYVNHIDDVQRIISDYVENNEIGGADLEAYLSLHEAFEEGEK
ncbi:DUF1617 family protein [Lacticaseibacillus paracasei]|uniref:DUF1617 family protein n=1 Tax=Lacticaseibacillus paracasei TaxID=1597 RepID=UPI0021E96A3F|nr:DUF1617 family protein [Lacticaseibacillus paracasei]UYI60610.1 DUF1617 family protein [Lacticaseibacillus paracasei]